MSPEVELNCSGAHTHFSMSSAGRGPYTKGIEVTARLTWTKCTLIHVVAVDSVGPQVVLESPRVDCEQTALNEGPLVG